MSGNKGSYLFIGSLIGIRTTLATSIKVNETLSGSLRANRDKWKRLSDDEKSAYLAEQHEFAHHQLMTSSLAGVLYWRLNEAWVRDITWLSKELASFNLIPGRGMNLWDWWQKTGECKVKASAAICSGRLSYMNHVFKHLNLVAEVRDYLYSNEIPSAQITRREFSKMLSEAFGWCAERAGLSLNGEHHEFLDKSKNYAKIAAREPNQSTFLAKDTYNFQALFEAYSICEELFVLQVVGDNERAGDLLKKTLEGPFGGAMRVLIPLSKSSEWYLGFSPHIAKSFAMLMCNAPVDIAAYKEERRLEEILPWLDLYKDFSHKGISLRNLASITENIYSTLHQPLFTEKAEWLHYLNIPDIKSLKKYFSRPKSSDIEKFNHAVTSNAINQAAFTFKINLSSTYKLLMAWPESPAEYSKHFQSWFVDTKKSICILEYTDGLHISLAPTIQANEIPHLKNLITTQPLWVITGLLLRTHQYYLVKSYWDGTCRPALKIVVDKLKELLDKEIGKHSDIYYRYLTEITNQLEKQAQSLFPNTLVVDDFDLYCDQ